MYEQCELVRLKKAVMAKLSDIEKGFKRFGRIGALVDSAQQQESNARVETRLASVELYMKGLADALGVEVKGPKQEKAKGQTGEGLAENPRNDLEREERRRLKQKLKDAIEYTHDISTEHSPQDNAGWTEHVFGICRPDGRVGKEGSRSLLRLMVFRLYLSVITPT